MPITIPKPNRYIVYLFITSALAIYLAISQTQVQISASIGDDFARGWISGHKDGLDHIVNHSKIAWDARTNDWTPYALGYLSAWRQTCTNNGMTTGPDSECELTLDAN